MAGFASITNLPDYVYADNASFDGTERGGGLVTDGQLWIGNSLTGRPTVNTLIAGTNIGIVNSNGNITINNTMSAVIGTINGDSGSITGSTVTIFTNTATNNAGLTVNFTNSGSTSTFNVTDSNFNTTIGRGSGQSLASSSNTALGFNSLQGGAFDNNVAVGHLSMQISSANTEQNTSVGVRSGYGAQGKYCTYIGYESCANTISSGTHNSAVGWRALYSVSSGSFNSAIGLQCLNGLTTGSYNIGAGYQAGNSLTTSDSSNICIGNTGTSGDNNKIKIGTQGSGSGQQNECYIAGIAGVSVSNTQLTTINSSTGQLGSTLTPSVTSITVGGTTAGTLFAGATSLPTGFAAQSVNFVGRDTNYNVGVSRITDNSSGPQINFQKARGTFATPAIVSASDVAGQINFLAFDGTATRTLAQITAIVDGTPAANDMPGALVFNTTLDGTVSPAEAMRLSNNKTATFAGTVIVPSSTVTNLPAAASNTYGRRFVTDANATTFASIVAGGGANIVPVYSDGTNWRIG